MMITQNVPSFLSFARSSLGNVSGEVPGFLCQRITMKLTNDRNTAKTEVYHFEIIYLILRQMT